MRGGGPARQLAASRLPTRHAIFSTDLPFGQTDLTRTRHRVCRRTLPLQGVAAWSPVGQGLLRAELDGRILILSSPVQQTSAAGPFGSSGFALDRVMASRSSQGEGRTAKLYGAEPARDLAGCAVSTGAD